MREYTLTETATLIRKELRTAYPDVRFRVRCQSYSGGCSIHVSWENGPTQSQVHSMIKRFEGSDFDGMTDSKVYKIGEYAGEPAHFCVDFVSGSRTITDALYQVAAYQVHRKTRLPLLPIKDGRILGGEMPVPFFYNAMVDAVWATPAGETEWYSSIVHMVAMNTPTGSAATVKIPDSGICKGPIPEPVGMIQ